MLPGEETVEGESKRKSVRYVAAKGGKVENSGRRGAVQEERLFQVTGVSKPLASVSRILDKGNTVVFSRSGDGSYIRNEATGEKVPIIEDKGTFVMDVEFLEP